MSLILFVEFKTSPLDKHISSSQSNVKQNNKNISGQHEVDKCKHFYYLIYGMRCTNQVLIDINVDIMRCTNQVVIDINVDGMRCTNQVVIDINVDGMRCTNQVVIDINVDGMTNNQFQNYCYYYRIRFVILAQLLTVQIRL
jgi:hypothetical protein